MVVVQARVGRVSGGCGRWGARRACAQCWAPWVRPVTPPLVSAAAGQDTRGTSATSVPGVTLRSLVRRGDILVLGIRIRSHQKIWWIRIHLKVWWIWIRNSRI
jgi:hypothetical protein